MRKRLIISILLIIGSYLIAEVTANKVQQAIHSDLQHPYLYFTEDDKPELLERIQSNPIYQDIMERTSAEAKRLMYTPVVKAIYSEGEVTGFYRTKLREYRRAATTLAFVYQMTDDIRFAEKAFEFMDAIRLMPEWANLYHKFDIVYDRVWPWNVPDDQVNFSVDLEVVHTAYDIAVAFDWIYPALEKRQRDQIRNALLEKAITRVRGNYDYHWWATAYRCNWCCVCNSCLGVAALTLLPTDPQLVDVVAESYNRIENTLNEIGVDGGWQEGVSYWYYAIRTTINFADALKRSTNGALNLFSHPRISKNSVNCVLYNLLSTNTLVYFEDCQPQMNHSPYVYNKLATETGSQEAAWIATHVTSKPRDIFDIIWPASHVLPGLPDQPDHHFSSIDWVVMRSDFLNPETVVLACKAGMHNDPHHGHLDCGNFILSWRDQSFISELGRGPYDETYFNEARWDTPHASSAGHNVLFVNGEAQIPYFETVVRAKGNLTTVATLILPVEDLQEADHIAQSIQFITNTSGVLELSFAKSNQQYGYKFQPTKEGYALQ